jgi:hypothetical protein
MKRKWLIKIVVCMTATAYAGFGLIEEQNKVTALRMEIPKLEQEIGSLEEEAQRLKFELEIFENPSNLLCLAKHAEFSHLQFPYHEDVLVLNAKETGNPPVQTDMVAVKPDFIIHPFKLSVMLGAH